MKFNDYPKRTTIKITENMPEYYETRNFISVFCNKNAPSRKEMTQTQFNSCVIPHNAELPLCDSALSADLLTESSCIDIIKKGTITLIDRVDYQTESYFIYVDVDGLIDVYKFDKFSTTSDFTVFNKTDFKYLKPGETIEIDDFPFIKSALNSYEPISNSVGYGVNLRTISSIAKGVEEDGYIIDADAFRKFLIPKSKVFTINMGKGGKDKALKPIDGRLIPEIGKMIKRDVLITLINKTKYNVLGDTDQFSSEDENYYVHPNSFVTKIEVYCNEPIDVPELEKYRLEKLEMRRKIFEILNKYPDEKLTPIAQNYKSNFACSKFRFEKDFVNKPLIRITTCRLAFGGDGTKLTNMHGGKNTADRVIGGSTNIYIAKPGLLRDEYGERIDMIKSSSSDIKRNNLGALFERALNAISLTLYRKIRDNALTSRQVKEFLDEHFRLLGRYAEFSKLDLDEEAIMEWLRHKRLKHRLLPCSSGITMDVISEILQNAKDKIGHRRLTVYFGKRQLTDKFEVGEIFNMVLRNDQEAGNQTTSIAEVDLRGYPIENDAKKRTGRSLFTDKPGKFSILALKNLLNSVSSDVVDELINRKDITSLEEYYNSVGIGLSFKDRYSDDHIITDESEEDEDLFRYELGTQDDDEFNKNELEGFNDEEEKEEDDEY